MIYDTKNRKNLDIEYYAIAQNENGLGITLLSLDDCFSIIGDSSYSTIERAIAELEPDGILTKDWKRIIHN